MKRGWNEVGRLGRKGSRFPHVLVGRHGWCLRLGPNAQGDDRYYSGVPSLLNGLIEHVVRRRMGEGSDVRALSDLVGEIRDSMEFARGIARDAASRMAHRSSGDVLTGLASGPELGARRGVVQGVDGH